MSLPIPPGKKAYLNLGCGTRCHPDWVNLDIAPLAPGVIAHDLRTGLPFPDNSCEAVYHSHVLEHIPKSEARSFIRECQRVLKPGGILRVVVPDLEQICRLYLEKLKGALEGTPGAACDYEWMLLELMDQAVRTSSGGQMRAYLDRDPIPNQEFIEARIGAEGRNLIDILRRLRTSGSPGPNQPPKAKTSLARQWTQRLEGALKRRLVARWFGDDAAKVFAIGSFRLAGEVHQWMYDRYSLGKLLMDAGLSAPSRRAATESDLPEWARFELDTNGAGVPHKPDSLYMEGRK